MRPEHVFDRLAHRALGPSESDLAAGLELAVSAHRFSERAQAMVDDKLTFSATLMRAGEVDAANRVLAEVGEEVLAEEVALIERVNEVTVARSIEREHMTRGRLARTLALAMLSSSLLAFSAAGMAVAGLFRSDDQAVHGSDIDKSGSAPRNAVANSVRFEGKHRIPGLPVGLTTDQRARFRALTSGTVDERGLERFLLGILPPQLAAQVGAVMAEVVKALPDEGKQALDSLDENVTEKRSAAKDAEEASSQSAPDDDARADQDDQDGQPSPEPSRGERGQEGEDDEDGDDEDGLPLLDDGDDDDEEGN
jgi:hypothetical protein